MRSSFWNLIYLPCNLVDVVLKMKIIRILSNFSVRVHQKKYWLVYLIDKMGLKYWSTFLCVSDPLHFYVSKISHRISSCLPVLTETSVLMHTNLKQIYIGRGTLTSMLENKYIGRTWFLEVSVKSNINCRLTRQMIGYRSINYYII